MPTFKQIIEVNDKPWNRAVKVMITTPTLEGVDIRNLAQKAWCSHEEDRRGANNREGRGIRR
ncbi:MAG: hypothetical protein E6G89_05465 [Alphaproteobacteria bacterium]|nr:MAG: hypothetical protein E6G89_05465 [Alphaproteobacteria bacterium]